MNVTATITDRQEVSRTVDIANGYRVEYSKSVKDGKVLYSKVKLLTTDEAYEWKTVWQIENVERAKSIAEAIMLVTEYD
jgi:hypothetical protein